MFRSYVLVLYKNTLVLHPDIYIQNKYTEKKNAAKTSHETKIHAISEYTYQISVKVSLFLILQTCC